MTEFHHLHSFILLYIEKDSHHKMVLQTNEVCQIISTLSDNSGLKVTVNESLKGGLITGIVCTIGGLILGPVGLAFGGTLGKFFLHKNLSRGTVHK